VHSVTVPTVPEPVVPHGNIVPKILATNYTNKDIIESLTDPIVTTNTHIIGPIFTDITLETPMMPTVLLHS